MSKLLMIIFLSLFSYGAYIENAIVACQTLNSMKAIEPHIHKNSTRFAIPKDCLILTHNAQITIKNVVEKKYIKIIVNDLNLELYTLKSSLNTI